MNKLSDDGGAGEHGGAICASWEACAGTRRQVELSKEIKVPAGQRVAVGVWDLKAQPAFFSSGPRGPKGEVSWAGLPEGLGSYELVADSSGTYWASWGLTLWGDIAPLLRVGLDARPEPATRSLRAEGDSPLRVGPPSGPEPAARPLRVAAALIAAGEKDDRMGSHYSGASGGFLRLEAGQRVRLALDPVEDEGSTRVAAFSLVLAPRQN